MASLGERLKQHWIQQNVFALHATWSEETMQRYQEMDRNAFRGATDSQIDDFETRYKVRLPQDIRQYFSIINGMGGSCSDHMDTSLVCFWSIENVTSVAEKYRDASQSVPESDALFIFADYCIECFYFAIKLSHDPDQPTPVYWMGNLPEPKLADSFTDFAEIYLTDAELVINPQRDKNRK